jgi:hypothetical protein
MSPESRSLRAPRTQYTAGHARNIFAGECFAFAKARGPAAPEPAQCVEAPAPGKRGSWSLPRATFPERALRVWLGETVG